MQLAIGLQHTCGMRTGFDSPSRSGQNVECWGMMDFNRDHQSDVPPALSYLGCPDTSGSTPLPRYFDMGSLRCTEQCSRGTVRSKTNMLCSTCDSGSYSNTPDALACKPCAGGRYSTNIRESVGCSTCVPGRFSKSSAAVCSLCEPGQYLDQTAQSSCLVRWVLT